MASLVPPPNKDSHSPSLSPQPGRRESLRRVSFTGGQVYQSPDTEPLSKAASLMSNMSLIDSTMEAPFVDAVLQGYDCWRDLLKELRKKEEWTTEEIWMAKVMEGGLFLDDEYAAIDPDLKLNIHVAANKWGKMPLLERLQRIDPIPSSAVIRPYMLSPDMGLLTAIETLRASILNWNTSKSDFREGTDISPMEGYRYLKERIDVLNLKRIKVAKLVAHIKKKDSIEVLVNFEYGENFKIFSKDICLEQEQISGTKRHTLTSEEVEELITLGLDTNYEVYDSRNLYATQDAVYIKNTHPSHFRACSPPMYCFLEFDIDRITLEQMVAKAFVHYGNKAVETEAKFAKWKEQLASTYLLNRKLTIKV